MDPVLVYNHINQLADDTDQLLAMIRDLRNDVIESEQWEDGDLPNYLDDAYSICAKLFKHLDMAQSYVGKVV